MTSNANIELKTWGKYDREELEKRGLSPTQWNNLKEYVNELEIVTNSSDNPPRIVGEKVFHPGPWVGNYDGLVTVSPREVSSKQHEEMVDEVASFVYMLKKPIADAILSETPDLTVEGKVAYPRYSQTLLEYTEELLAGRLPVRVQREVSQGFEFEGTPDFKRIIKERARNSPMVVSEKTKFTFDTLANHLLYEFHRQLSAHLGDLIETYPYLPERIQKQRQHHTNFLETTIPSEVAKSNVSTDLRDPAVLTKIRRQSSGVMMEIVDLWEAFLHQRAQLDPFSNFVATIKPVYEVFEVWCLHKILEILEDEYGSWNSNRHRSTASKFDFVEEDALLYYDTSVSDYSRYVANNEAFGKEQSGRPDFLFVLNDEVRWMADAKFQDVTDLDISGIQRFLGYLIDFICLNREHTPPTALLGIGDGSGTKTFAVEGVEIKRLSLMTADETEDSGLVAVRDMITRD